MPRGIGTSVSREQSAGAVWQEESAGRTGKDRLDQYSWGSMHENGKVDKNFISLGLGQGLGGGELVSEPGGPSKVFMVGSRAIRVRFELRAVCSGARSCLLRLFLKLGWF